MKKWQIVAYAEHEEGYLPRKETVVEASTYELAIWQGYNIFPEYHEVGAFEIEEDNK